MTNAPRARQPAARPAAPAKRRAEAHGQAAAGLVPPDAQTLESAGLLWETVLARLSARMSMFSFRGFVEPLRAVSCNETGLVLLAPTAFHRDWARDHYADEIGREACAVAGSSITVQILFDPKLQAALVAQAALAHAKTPLAQAVEATPDVVSSPGRQAKGAVVALAGAKEAQHNRLHPRYSFDAFVATPGTRLALAAAVAVAERPGETYAPLVIVGGTGLGKTHLLHAIGHDTLARHPKKRVAVLSAEQWVNEYVRDVQERRFADFRRRYRDGVDVLLLDDLHFLAGKVSSQEEFVHAFDALCALKKQVVVTVDRPLHTISGLDPKLRTRLLGGLVVEVAAPDGPARTNILRHKAEALGCALPLDVAELLATHLTSSVRELEGALVRLQAYSSISRAPIDLALAREQLAPMLALSERPSLARVLDVVAAYYGMRPKDLVGPSRQRQVARARQVAMWLVREHLGQSLPEIGRAFGGRDHTTVLVSVRKVDELCQSDAGVSAVVSKLAKTLFP